MVGGAPGVNCGPQQPQTITERDSQAAVEVTKKYVLGMVMDTLAEVIPFTQREYNELFKYRSEADRPVLAPLMQLRTTAPGSYITPEETWGSVYNELVDSLPDTVKAWLTLEMSLPLEKRDPEFVVVNNVLTAASKALDWLAASGQPPQVNTSSEQGYIRNIGLPYIALMGIASQSKASVEMALQWINTAGANYPYYDGLSNVLTQTTSALNTLEELKDELKKGDSGSHIQQSFIELSYEFDRLSTQLATVPTGNEFKILQTQLNALAIITASFGPNSGPSPLFLGTTLASIGLNNGQSYSTMVEALFNGILQMIDFSPRAETTEMISLYNDLKSLR